MTTRFDAPRPAEGDERRLPGGDWTCEICGSPACEFFAREANYTLLRCRGCRVIAVWPKPDRETLAASYARRIEAPGAHDYWANYLSREASFRAHGRHVLGLLAPHCRPPGRLLDVGCGPGFLLDEARRAGWDVRGVDLAEPFVAWGREHLALDLRLGELEAHGFPSESFDAAVMIDVLSHLMSPLQTIRELYRVLRPSGVLFLQAGNKAEAAAKQASDDWETPLHLFHYTRPAIRGMLEREGFAVERMQFASRIHVPEGGRRLLGRLPFAAAAYRLLCRAWGACLSKTAASDGTVFVVARKAHMS
jgi:SAM-dependent methyltransferase